VAKIFYDGYNRKTNNSHRRTERENSSTRRRNILSKQKNEMRVLIIISLLVSFFISDEDMIRPRLRGGYERKK
tara:strand:+ start:94 stop:312 length:219 start_codon:yes stop_codon:yes gene_type:complete